MTTRRSKARKSKVQSPPVSPTAPAIPPKYLPSLLCSHFQSGHDVKPILKCLYGLIGSCSGYDVDQAENGLKLKLGDRAALSGILFEELSKKLPFSSDGTSSKRNFKMALAQIYSRDSGEELLLLLRCCVLMPWLNPQAVTGSFQEAVAFLPRLCFEMISSQRIIGGSEISPSDNFCSSIPLLKKMLEVYLDEVFVDRSFLERLSISDTVSSRWQSQFGTSNLQIHSVGEVIGAHFLLSVSGDHALQTFFKTLVWMEKAVPFRPELCLTVGLSLIKHPVLISFPVILHSHLISLVSEAVAIRPVPGVGLNVRSWKTCLSAFFESVILYGGHFSKLMTSSSCRLQTLRDISGRPFQSLFHSEIYDRVNLVLLDMDAAWRAQAENTFTKTASSMASDAISYIQSNIYTVDVSCRDHVSAFMSSLITKIVSAKISEHLVQGIRARTLHEICELASILKLMSCSLLQVARYSKSLLSYFGSSSNIEDVLPGYTSLSGIMSSFADYSLLLPIEIQQLVDEFLKFALCTYDGYKLMFMHFAGLLSLCIVSGLDVLVEGCLVLMLVIADILTQKDSGSESVRPPVALGTESAKHAFSPSSFTSPPIGSTGSLGGDQKLISSIRAASKFRRTRQLLLRHQKALEVSDVSGKETCSGEVYLRCLIDNEKDIGELADFIVCNPQKDYAAWLQDRGGYRSQRLKKLAKQRKMRKMKVYRTMAVGNM